MEPTHSIHEWLETVKSGFSKFTTAFTSIGCDLVDDLSDMTSDERVAVAAALTTIGAKRMHVRKIMEAVAARHACVAGHSGSHPAPLKFTTAHVTTTEESVFDKHKHACWHVLPFLLIIAAVVCALSSSVTRSLGRYDESYDADDPLSLRSTRTRKEGEPATSAKHEEAENQNTENQKVEVVLDDASDIAAHRRRLGSDLEGVEYSKNITALKEFLMDGYAPATPPGNCQVQVEFSLQKLLDVQIDTQTLHFIGWWRHYWIDHRLDWTPSEWGGVEFITFTAYNDDFGEVWRPDDLVYEAFETVDIIPTAILSIYPGGRVFYSRPLVHRIPCPMSTEAFPFDTQKCSFTLGSWSFHGGVVDVLPRLVNSTPSAISLSNYHTHTEFALTHTTTDHYNTYYTCCPEPYPLIAYELKLRRTPLPYFNGIILPLILTTISGFFAFFINPKAGERIGLGITVLLTTGVIYSIAMDLLPKTGLWSPFSYLYIFSVVVSMLTLMQSVLAVSLSNTVESDGPMSERALINVFLKHDADNSGTMDADELHRALQFSSLEPAHLSRLTECIKEAKAESRAAEAQVAEAGKQKISFLQWYDIVAQIAESDGLAANHNVVVWCLVRTFHSRMRKASHSSFCFSFVPPLSVVTSVLTINCPLQKRRAHFARRAESIRQLSEKTPTPSSTTSQESVVEISVPIDWSHPTHVKRIEVDNNQLDDKVVVAGEHPSNLVNDPSDLIGRQLTGQMDAVLSLVIPGFYIIACMALFAKYASVITYDPPDTVLTHIGSQDTKDYQYEW